MTSSSLRRILSDHSSRRLHFEDVRNAFGGFDGAMAGQSNLHHSEAQAQTLVVVVLHAAERVWGEEGPRAVSAAAARGEWVARRAGVEVGGEGAVIGLL